MKKQGRRRRRRRRKKFPRLKSLTLDGAWAL